MTTRKALHPRDDIDRLYVSRKRGIRLASIDDSFNASIHRLEDCINTRSTTDYSHRKRDRQHDGQQNDYK